MTPTNLKSRRSWRIATMLVGAALVAGACGTPDADVAGPAATPSDQPLAPTTASAPDPSSDEATAATGDHAPVGFPVTVQNCGLDITLERPPERVLLLGRAGIFAILEALGVADRVVARAGAFPDAYYDDAGRADIADIASLGDDLDASGHLQISQEVIIDTDPDLVVGLPDGIERNRLADVGIPALEQPANCPEGVDDVSYDDIYDQVELYGQVFDRADRAAEVVGELQERIAAVEEAASTTEERTAAILYPTVGGGTLYAYGSLSMSHRQVETAGLTNVFGDTEERVFEVTNEEIIARDPDVLVLLHVDGEPGPVKQAVVNLPGADGITAIRDDAILTQLFNFGEYPTPLVVDGLERIVDAFGSGT